MYKVVGVALALGIVAGCTQTNPGALGSGTPAETPRDLALETGATLQPPADVTAQTLGPAQNTSIELQQALQTPGSTASAQSQNALPATDPLVADTAAALGTTGALVTPVPASNNAGISDEQDFNAVSNRQSIESDAERIAAAAAAREQVQPTALPERQGASSTNIVAYALNNTHPVGTRLYSRTGINLQNRALRACAGYPSPDQAQIDFLASGGPTRDRKGLDPDGDGYACAWDPTPFRAAIQG